MTCCLLDVNVLLALAWPNHVHHAAAHAWLAECGRPWATCPLTQTGFVRLSCNPAVVGRTVLAAEALSLLAANTALPDHVFWPAELTLADAVAPFRGRLVGHRQLVDAYLLGLALHHGGQLATFDRGLAALVAGTPHAETVVTVAC